MKSKDDKHKDFEALRREFEKSPTMFVTGFDRLTVQQDLDLRRTVRQAGGRYRVIKNNIAAKASEGLPAEPLFANLRGMTSLACTDSDPVTLAKALTNYAKSNPAFTFKAGFVEGRAVEIGNIRELATLPSREELLAKVLFLIQSPAQRLVTAISGVGRNLAVVVDQGVQENKFQE
ncbi:MAG: 50S ribosomal protein L10 [Acidobacteria bacterium]|nr:50S ribosomal protein L10 [Acidobacteriota bacterium]MBI3282387.1 50S ribosomal protein L10 [Acidobacteriota bacterium]